MIQREREAWAVLPFQREHGEKRFLSCSLKINTYSVSSPSYLFPALLWFVWSAGSHAGWSAEQYSVERGGTQTNVCDGAAASTWWKNQGRLSVFVTWAGGVAKIPRKNQPITANDWSEFTLSVMGLIYHFLHLQHSRTTFWFTFTPLRCRRSENRLSPSSPAVHVICPTLTGSDVSNRWIHAVTGDWSDLWESSGDWINSQGCQNSGLVKYVNCFYGNTESEFWFYEFMNIR